MSERSEHDVESELRRLFDDERLTVSIAPGAREAVVSRARRLRRRRELAMAGSGIGVVVVAAVGVGMLTMQPSDEPHGMAASPGTDATLSTAPRPAPSSAENETPDRRLARSRQSSTPGTSPGEAPPAAKLPDMASSRAPRVPAITNGPIGPNGWSDIKLGMSYEELQAAGHIDTDAAPPQSCTSYSLTTGDEFVSSVMVSESGVGRIVAGEKARTPEDIGAGSKMADLLEAYPEADGADGQIRAQTEAGSTYVFTVPKEKVTGFALTNGDC